MAFDPALQAAVKNLLASFAQFLKGYDCDKFLKSDVDPFRFRFNEVIGGTQYAIKNEVVHKLAMKMEDWMGNLHEDFLSAVTHHPSGQSWHKVRRGEVKGADIRHDAIPAYLQLKSKHNSMNSDSSTKLAEHLAELKQRFPTHVIGCGWVIAGRQRRCIGEEKVERVAKVFKGDDLIQFITGTDLKLEEVLAHYSDGLQDELRKSNYKEMIDQACADIGRELERRAVEKGVSVADYLLQIATGYDR